MMTCTQNTDRECRTEDCCLNETRKIKMTKKTCLIPFNYKLYKDGATAVFRNSLLHLLGILPSESEEYPFVYVAKDNKYGGYEADSITSNGFYVDENNIDDRDVLLEQKTEEKTFYVNVYNSTMHSQFLARYCSLEDARNNRDNDCLGTIKVSYADEDLIK